MASNDPTGPSPFDFLQWMPSATAAFERAARARRYEDGQIIYAQGNEGDEMFRLVSGSVRLSACWNDGREFLYVLFGPGDCFGDSSVVDGGPRPQTAQALGTVEVQALSRRAFLDLRARYPEVDQAMIHLLSRQMRFADRFRSGRHVGQSCKPRRQPHRCRRAFLRRAHAGRYSPETRAVPIRTRAHGRRLTAIGKQAASANAV